MPDRLTPEEIAEAKALCAREWWWQLSAEEYGRLHGFALRLLREVRERRTVDESERQDAAIVNWIEEFIQSGVLTTAFELDGGVHVTLEPVGGPEIAARNQSTFREAMEFVIQLSKEKTNGK